MPDHTIGHPSSTQRTPPPENEPFTIDEIIGQPPGWILRSGMTVLFIVVAIGISMTIVIRYPDKIQAAGVITTKDPFKAIVPLSTGIVDTLYVQHDDLLAKDELILFIENTAEMHDVDQSMEQVDLLENALDQMGRSRTNQLLHLLVNWQNNYTLGPMQPTFASLGQQVREFLYFLRREDYALKLEAINQEIEEIHSLNEVLEQEKALTRKEVALSESDLERNQQLFDHGVISERDMERSQVGHLGIRKNFLLKDNSMAQNRIRIASLEQQKIEILATRKEQMLLYRSRLSEIILILKNQYHQWKQQYYIDAPASGRVQLSSGIVPGQTIPSGQSIGYIIPAPDTIYNSSSNSNPKYAKVFVPSTGMGRIQPGNRVIIRLEAYPYKEYGTLESHVREIYPIADVQEDGVRIYEIHIPLESNLRTDYDYPIRYTPEMPIHADIIAKERSLFSRIFDQFLNLLHQHTFVQTHDRASPNSNSDVNTPDDGTKQSIN